MYTIFMLLLFIILIKILLKYLSSVWFFANNFKKNKSNTIAVLLLVFKNMDLSGRTNPPLCILRTTTYLPLLGSELHKSSLTFTTFTFIWIIPWIFIYGSDVTIHIAIFYLFYFNLMFTFHTINKWYHNNLLQTIWDD